MLAERACQEDRPLQIKLEAVRPMRPGRLFELAHQVVLQTATVEVNVTSSGHSVDIVAPGVTKLNAIRQLRERLGDVPVLAIGDRGSWPGNDHELLREPFALGVDEINADPTTCWHLGKPGQRGPAVTLEYLRALEPYDDRLRFPPRALR